MRHRSAPPPLDAATVAAILRRLTAERRQIIDAIRQRSGLPLLAFWDSWLGSDGRGYGEHALFVPGSDGDMFRVARQHLWDIEAERQADAVATEFDPMGELADPAQTPDRRRPGPPERDDSAHLAAMRELIAAGTEASPWAAARAIVGADNESAIKRLVPKYYRWEAAGFPA